MARFVGLDIIYHRSKGVGEADILRKSVFVNSDNISFIEPFSFSDSALPDNFVSISHLYIMHFEKNGLLGCHGSIIHFKSGLSPVGNQTVVLAVNPPLALVK